MSASVDELRARLAAVMSKPGGANEDRAEIADMFEECQRRSLEFGWEDDDEPRFMLRDPPPDDPLPTSRERGRRYCRRCGAHKREDSFDPGAEACRSHDDGPRRASAA